MLARASGREEVELELVCVLLLLDGPGGGGEARASERRGFLCARGPVGGNLEDALPAPLPFPFPFPGSGTWYEFRGECEWDFSARGAVVRIAVYDLSSSFLRVCD